jgi:CheY-like chemotaxis protein
MDIQMPEMDGLETTRWIRQRERDRKSPDLVPVIAPTAHASQAQHDQLSGGRHGWRRHQTREPLRTGELHRRSARQVPRKRLTLDIYSG